MDVQTISFDYDISTMSKAVNSHRKQLINHHGKVRNTNVSTTISKKDVKRFVYIISGGKMPISKQDFRIGDGLINEYV